MEIVENIKDAAFTPDWKQPIEEIAEAARHYATTHLRGQLTYYRTVRPEHVTADIFWGEYVWCVYASGFNARVVSKMYPRLMAAYKYAYPGDGVTGTIPKDAIGLMVQPINSNRQKFNAVMDTSYKLHDMGWDEFKRRYLTDVDNIPRGCSYIGKITKYHLGRNIGLDCVKPDLHLVRVARHYGFAGPRDMCDYLADPSVLNERVGVVDFILWAYCAAYGTKELD